MSILSCQNHLNEKILAPCCTYSIQQLEIINTLAVSSTIHNLRKQYDLFFALFTSEHEFLDLSFYIIILTSTPNQITKYQPCVWQGRRGLSCVHHRIFSLLNKVKPAHGQFPINSSLFKHQSSN